MAATAGHRRHDDGAPRSSSSLANVSPSDRARSPLTMPAVPHLRRDLQWLPGADASERQASSQVLLLDPLRNSFARIDREPLEQLAAAPSACDPQLLASANAAGLLRSRTDTRGAHWHPVKLLSIRLPGLTSAPVAAWLARRSDWLFGPVAVLGWCTMMGVALLAIPRSEERRVGK